MDIQPTLAGLPKDGGTLAIVFVDDLTIDRNDDHFVIDRSRPIASHMDMDMGHVIFNLNRLP